MQCNAMQCNAMVCMYVCMDVCMYACMYVCMYVNLFIHLSTFGISTRHHCNAGGFLGRVDFFSGQILWEKKTRFWLSSLVQKSDFSCKGSCDLELHYVLTLGSSLETLGCGITKKVTICFDTCAYSVYVCWH